MSLFGAKRRKKTRLYEVLIIPHGDGGRTKSIKAGSMQFAFWGGALCVAFFLVYSLAFRYTPLGIVVGADPSLRAAVDSAENETQRRIRALAEEVAVLKDYNLQLRKALGDRTLSLSAEKLGAAEQLERPKDEQNPAPESAQMEYADFSPPTPASSQVVASAGGLRAPFPLIVPVNGIVTRQFEPAQKHFGVDLAAKQGTPVHAAAPGYVMFAGWTYEDGNVVMLSHGPGYVTVYKHNSTLLKSTGSFVRRGEVIALAGNTGTTSKGPHLHFEVLKDGVPQDPQDYLLTATKRRSW